MADFNDTRRIAEALSAWMAKEGRSEKQRRRGRVAYTGLTSPGPNLLRTEPEMGPPHWQSELIDLSSKWQNITLSARRVAAIERELDAAWALTIAWSLIISEFLVSSNHLVVNEIFGIDVEHELSVDAQRHAEIIAEDEKASRWPLVAVGSVIALSVAAGDTVAGNDGTATAVLAMGAIGGAVYCFYSRRELRRLSAERFELERKWNGIPRRNIELR